MRTSPNHCLNALVLLLACALAGCSKSPEALLERAQESAEAGKPSAAVLDLKNALEQRPDYAAARRLLGEQYLRLGDSNSAIKELRRALELGEPEKDLLPLILRAQIDGGEAKQALEQLAKIPAEELTAALWALRGEAFLETRDVAAGSDAFATALRLDPKNADAQLGIARLAWAKGDAAAATRAFALALQYAPGIARPRLVRGEFALAYRDFKTAVADFTSAMKLSQGFDKLRARIGLARALIFQGDKVNAQQQVDILLQQAPGMPLPHYLAALLAHQKSDWKRAEQELEIVLSKTPEHLPSLFLKGVVSAAQEKWIAADQELSRLVAMVPRDLPSRKLLATVYLREQQYEKAIATLEEGMSVGGNDSQYIAMLGGAYMRAGQAAKGMALMQRAAKLAPQRTEYQTQVALGHLAMGEGEIATQQLRAAARQSSDDMRSDVLLVMVLLRERKYDDALAEAQRLIKENPRDPMRFNLAAAAWLGKQNEVEATKALQRALALDPKFGPAKLNLALIAQRNNNIETAHRLYSETFAEDKTNYRALAGLVTIDVQRNRGEQVVALLDRVRVDQPSALEPRSMLLAYYRQIRNFAAALQIAKECLDIQPRNAAVRLNYGEALLAVQSAREAVDVLGPLARDAPDVGPVQFALARAKHATGNLIDARSAIERAVELSGRKDAAALAMAVVIALEGTRVADAKSLLTELRAIAGEAPDVQALAGDIALADGRPADAVTSYRKLLQARPTTDSMGKLARALGAAGRSVEAKAELTGWLQRNPRDTGAQLLLADLAMNAGEHAEAQRIYESVLQRSPNHPLVLNNLAWLYFQRNDRRAALLSERALSALPDNPEIMDTAAWIRFRRGNKDGVLAMLQKAADRSPNPEIRYHIAEVLVSNGDRLGARRQLDTILAEGAPGFPSRPAAALLRQRL